MRALGWVVGLLATCWVMRAEGQAAQPKQAVVVERCPADHVALKRLDEAAIRQRITIDAHGNIRVDPSPQHHVGAESQDIGVGLDATDFPGGGTLLITYDGLTKPACGRARSGEWFSTVYGQPTRLPRTVTALAGKELTAEQLQRLDPGIARRRQATSTKGVSAREKYVHSDFRWLVVHQLPEHASGPVRVIPLPPPQGRLEARGPVTLLVQGVPLDQPLTSSEERVVSGPGTLSYLDILKLLLVITQGAQLSSTKTLSAEQLRAELDSALTPLVPYGTKIVRTQEPGAFEDIAVTLCEAAKCEPKTDKTTVLGRVLLSRYPHWGGFTFLIDVAANFGPRHAFGLPSYTPVGEPSAGEQAYRLEFSGPRVNLFTVGVLASTLFGPPTRPDLFMLGFGPALIPKAEGGLRQQWDVKLGVRLVASTYVTLGVGFRRVSLARVDRLGSLKIGNSDAAPQLKDTEEAWVAVGSVGLSIDIARLGSDAIGIVKGGG